MKETFYFSHDFNARNDWKLVKVMMKHWVSGIGIYWCMVEMLYEEWWSLMLSECERIAFELRTSCEIVQSIIDDFDLFRNDGNVFFSKSVLERINRRNEKSEKARISAEKRWKDKWVDANALRTQSECNAIKERKGKEIKEKNIIISSKEDTTKSLIVSENKSKPEINNLIDSIKQTLKPLWLIYKAGKQERQRAQNILTAKEFWETCEKAWMSREKFVIEIIKLSAKLDFWNWKIYNCETFYEHYPKVYNEARRLKESKKVLKISTITF